MPTNPSGTPLQRPGALAPTLGSVQPCLRVPIRRDVVFLSPVYPEERRARDVPKSFRITYIYKSASASPLGTHTYKKTHINIKTNAFNPNRITFLRRCFFKYRGIIYLQEQPIGWVPPTFRRPSGHEAFSAKSRLRSGPAVLRALDFHQSPVTNHQSPIASHHHQSPITSHLCFLYVIS